MTDEQRKHFYFPIWRETSVKLDWVMIGGRLSADLNAQRLMAERWPDHAARAVTTIITEAQKDALQDRRGATAEDLRHGCNWIASNGQYSSSTKFTQRHLNHFDRLCAVLRDPWDLTATMAWLNPAEDDRQRTLKYLHKIADEGRLVAIARNAWHTGDINGLTQSQLDWLTGQVRGQRRYGTPSGVATKQPF